MNIIKKQFEEAKLKKLLEIQDNYIEGEIIKKESRIALLNEQKRKEMAKLEIIKQNEEFVKRNEDLKKEAEKLKLKELEEDKKIKCSEYWKNKII